MSQADFGKLQGMLVLAAIASREVAAAPQAAALPPLRDDIFDGSLDIAKPADNVTIKKKIRDMLKQGGFDPVFVDSQVDLTPLDNPAVFGALKLLNDKVQFVANYQGTACCFKSLVASAIAQENAQAASS